MFDFARENIRTSTLGIMRGGVVNLIFSNNYVTAATEHYIRLLMCASR